MKYSTPKIEYVEVETQDIMSASREGSLTIGDTTITGPQDDFSVGYSDLLG